MNPWQVEWNPLAEQELARLWLLSSDPAGMTAAQARIDQLLSRNPAGYGRFLSEGLYAIDVPPLTATYEIDDNARLVTVTWVRLST
jgi:hypothetical protein